MPFHPAPLLLPTEAATEALAGRMAPLLQAGDSLLLGGPIGAGKSFFARALIRARLRNPEEDVPSPSFTLVQTYQAGDVEIVHCDLFRLAGGQDLIELGLDAAFGQAICLIEWPDRLGDRLPPDPLHLDFAAMADHHRMVLRGSDTWAQRLAGHLD